MIHRLIAEVCGVNMPHFFGDKAWSGAVLIPLFIVMTFHWFKQRKQTTHHEQTQNPRRTRRLS